MAPKDKAVKKTVKRWDLGGDAQAKDSDDGHPLVALARGLSELVSQHGLSELILDTSDVTLTVRRGVTASVASQPVTPVLHTTSHAPAFASGLAAYNPAPPAAAPAAAAVEDDKAHAVTCPFVGTFYRKPNPDSANYVNVGDRVEKGAVLCIIEAMKLMNEIEADVAGTITAILVEDGSTVEYGQPLFKIRP
jgi:acetyl-CoA carboxylase biotin carboxyl carrier protein